MLLTCLLMLFSTIYVWYITNPDYSGLRQGGCEFSTVPSVFPILMYSPLLSYLSHFNLFLLFSWVFSPSVSLSPPSAPCEDEDAEAEVLGSGLADAEARGDGDTSADLGDGM